MEIYLAIAASFVVAVLAVMMWTYTSIKKHEIQFGSIEKINELEAELKRQAGIVNRLDEEGLDEVLKKADLIAGRLKEAQISGLLARR